MSEEATVRVKYDELKRLMKTKFMKAGLPDSHAEAVADHLAYADSRGVHSHGAVRVEYYSERIAKGGSNAKPDFKYDHKSDSITIIDGDNAVGHLVALMGTDEAIRLAEKTGVGVVGMKRLGHCGTLSYFLRKAAEKGYIMLSMAQSDPMVVLYGGAEPYFGTNPIGFCAPRKNGEPVIFDMATTVGAWGKILDSRSKGKAIPDTWAVDSNGRPTTDPNAVAGLVPVAGAKGSGLMMMVDILAGVLLGQPSGKHVSSMYADLSAGRELGQIHIALNPGFFVGREAFLAAIDDMVGEIHALKPADGFDRLFYPGERSESVAERYRRDGIPIVKEIYDYLVSDDVHFNRYDNMNAFAKN
ncbi:MAG: ureidoglycolate dehydrogenase [Planctomycetota bacterium]|jgi:ureidoglycolate dehydrogenase (NAD+)|nr:ureidoglycolate dehydrogenase [Planctomycetota bacterium]